MTPRIAAATAFIALLSLLLLMRTTPGEAGSIPFTVNSAGDASDSNIGDNFCATAGAVCTQRAAIEEANVAAEVHDIHYDLPSCPGAGCVIGPLTFLPFLTRDNVTVDGTTQTGFTGTPLVTIDGSLAGAANGINLEGSNQTLKGMLIRKFMFNGVLVGGISEPGPQIVTGNQIETNGLDGVNGEIFCTGNFSVTGNTITGNARGVSACGAGIEIHFNRIVDNTLGVEDIGGAEFSLSENNWWGCNEGPFSGPDCDTVIGATDSDPWLVMSFVASPGSIPGGGASNLVADLVTNSDASDTSASGHVLDGSMFVFETDLGSVGSSSVAKPTSDGVAKATLTADEGPGTANVSARIDNEVLGDTVTITSAPPTPTPTPSPTPTPTDTAAPSDTPAPTPTPSPTATAGPELTQGDVDCDEDVDGPDGAKVLADSADLGYRQEPDCPAIGSTVASLFGDVDCDDDVDPFDALAIFAHVAGLVQDNGACPDIGDPLT